MAENTLEKDDRLKRVRSDFAADFAAESEWRKQKKEYGQFYDGEQLTSDEIETLKQRGQPPVVVNRIKPKMDAIFGIQQALQVDTRVYPAGNREIEALEVSEEIRRVEDESSFDEQESIAFEDLCIDGRGWYKIFKEFDGVEGIDRVKHVANDNIVIDRYCPQEDLRTGELKRAKRIHETIWMDLEDAQELFPHAKDELAQIIDNPEMNSPVLAEKLKEHSPDQYKQGGNDKVSDSEMLEFLNFVDKKRKRLRVVTTYYRKPVVSTFIKHSTGTYDVTDYSDSQIEKLKKELDGITEWSETKYTLNTVTFVWNKVLEEKKDIRPYDRDAKYPLILVPGYLSRDEKKLPYGLVKQQMDAQREVNKRRSKMLHLLNVNQVWFEEGAFSDEGAAKREIARPDGWIKFRKEFKVENVRHQDLAASQFQLLQESKQEIDTAGINREIEGRSNSSSGREFQLRQQQAMQSLRKLFMNLRSARKRMAEYLLDEILHRKPDLQVSRFDLVIDEAPDTINLMGETFESLVSLSRGGMPVPIDMIIEASPLQAAKKQEFLKRIQEQEQQKVQMMQMQQQAMLAQAAQKGQVPQ